MFFNDALCLCVAKLNKYFMELHKLCMKLTIAILNDVIVASLVQMSIIYHLKPCSGQVKNE